ITPEGTTFNLYEEGSYRDQLTIPMYGAHNVQNALAVVAAAEQVGVPWEKTVTGLGSFPGVKRRLELRGVINGIHVYDDFAHHPTAVEATLCGLRSAYPDKRIWAIFEPRTATTIRRIFQAGYSIAFDAADYILFAPIYLPNKAPEGNRFSLEELIDGLHTRGLDALALPDVDRIVNHLIARVQPGDHLVFMSNGGFDSIHEKMLKKLEAL
ncbi:MAG TPA: hypothetical protein DIT99_12345, partial [Candidatus Latescibacteria bacterium]|nr:hypothetical protein [Candidatus Latescibacterota bacterium]